MTILAWGAWLIVMVLGVAAALSRQAHEGYSSVSLPRLLFFLWVLVCVLALGALRHFVEAGLALAVAVGVAVYAFGASPGSVSRKREFDERLEGARRALAEDPNNSMSEELLGDLYSTLEERGLALKHWRRALELRSDAKLREKVAALEREPPVFHVWGLAAAHDWRACPACGSVQARLAARCSACGRLFFEAPGSWHAAVLDRFCEENGADALLKLALFLLPILIALGPLPYAAAWFLWGVAVRRPALPRREDGAGARLRGRAALAGLLVAASAAASRVSPADARGLALRALGRGAAVSIPAPREGSVSTAALDSLLAEAESGRLGEGTRAILEADLARLESEGALDRPLDGTSATGRQLLEEARQGVLGPAGRAYLDRAAERGALDLPIPGRPGMTFRGALEEARALASRAEALAEERARVAGEQGGLGADADPVKIIPQAIEHLNSEEPARRVFGAQLLCEVKVARHPLAQSARAELERARASNDPDLAGFAAMALRRLDYFKARRASTPRS